MCLASKYIDCIFDFIDNIRCLFIMDQSSKLGFIARLINGFGSSLVRFPMSFITLLIGIGALVFNVEIKDLQLVHTAMVCGLGIPLFYSIVIYGETRRLSKKVNWIIQLTIVALLVGYFFTLPEENPATSTEYIRYTLLFISVHLLVAFIPFLFRSNEVAFWNYNRISFSRLFISLLFSHILFGGISLIYLALHELFKVKIEGEFVLQTYIVVAGIFNTWFFFAGVPSKWEDLSKDEAFPKNFKILTLYILLPLVGIYTSILLFYELKIVLTWDFPKGVVSYMILIVGVVGLLNLLLMYPLKRLRPNLFRWIRIIYFTALIPLLGLLYYAIFVRVKDYGITENRYFLLAVALWLTGILVYFIVGKKLKIEVIPISLFLIVTLASFGPWGAFYVSQISQKRQAISILENYALYKNDQYVENSNVSMSYKDSKRLFGSINYLVEHAGSEYVNNMLQLKKPIDADKYDRWSDDDYFKEAFNLKILQKPKTDYSYRNTRVRSNSIYQVINQSSIDISQYSKCLYLPSKLYSPNTSSNEDFEVKLSNDKIIVILDSLEQEIVFDLRAHLDSIHSQRKFISDDNLSPEEINFENENGKIIFNYIRLDWEDPNQLIKSFEGMILLK